MHHGIEKAPRYREAPCCLRVSIWWFGVWSGSTWHVAELVDYQQFVNGELALQAQQTDSRRGPP
jgi:hypothetical protein